MQQHDSILAPLNSRRRFLKIIPGLATVTLAPVAAFAAVPETPAEKVNRLAEDLSHALDEYAGGTMHAKVFPASAPYGGLQLMMPDSGRQPEAILQTKISEMQSRLQEMHPEKKWRSHMDKGNSFLLFVGDKRASIVVQE